MKPYDIWLILGVYLVVSWLLALLPGCAMDTSVPEWVQPRWQLEAVSVCSDPYDPYEEATIAATQAWNVGPELVYVGACPADIAVVPGKGSLIAKAVTSTRYWPKTHAIQSATIYVNEYDGYDLQAILTHELGHAIGLHDSDVYEATMFGWVGPGELRARTLDKSDVEAVEALYEGR